MGLAQQIIKGNRTALGQGITLLESTLPEHEKQAQDLITACTPYSGNSIRVGVTGVPGVGKSTFIEAFGKLLTSQGKKVAVLAIDPTSERTHGSILGDKSRMHELAADDNAFIRPSPSSGTLGGVANKTRESIILCEAAGFEIILIETVGVGQSETTVSNLVDFFLLLMLAGAGDELQGIKRGIMELADTLVITKAEGDNLQKAKNAAMEYKRALHLFPAMENGWIPEVSTCSSLENTGIADIFETITKFDSQMTTSGWKAENRKGQNTYWLHHIIKEELGNKKYQRLKENNTLKQAEELLKNGRSIYEILENL
ncbi:MAG: methylmalonyl Co-A mutase-associated GTPase MeaB [Flavobacteriales bacterium]|jgi:LAO/AO transport system kinase|nr:methylmalonyl Co-A mutase-associated GTPase MeaB [Flavobacteriales bacterium]